MLTLVSFFILGLAVILAFSSSPSPDDRSHLQAFTYREDFESEELNAWASYPPNQDTAYDPYIYPCRVRPEDPGKCLVIKAEPQWHEDNLLGAVKLLDLVLDRSFSLRFRFHLKTTDRCPELLVHLPLADGRRLSYRKPDPQRNEWAELRVAWDDLAAQGQILDRAESVRLTALAVTVRIEKADPSMPTYLGIDDVEVRGIKEKEFIFLEPEAAGLSEWKEKIGLKHYRQGSVFRLLGTLDFLPDDVVLTICPFSDRNRVIWTSPLQPDAQSRWKSPEFVLSPDRFPAGLYLGLITARRHKTLLSQTQFTLFVEPREGLPAHPRILCSADKIEVFRQRLLGPRFQAVLDRFLTRAKSYREQIVPDKIVFDVDQFPDRDWVVSLPAWYRDRFMAFREALFTNAVSHLSGRDDQAAAFIKALLLRLADWPQWNHPWMEARGFHTYYPLGEFADSYAAAYDAVYDLLSEEERKAVRTGLLRNFIDPAYRTYVEDNQVTSNSSNWISHIAGGALVALMAVAGDDPAALGDLEPWLTGFILKEQKYISTVFGPDGSYGEGFRYYNFAMQSFARTIPALKRIFGLDLSGPFLGSHLETLWTSILQKNVSFGFGDTESYLKQEAQAWWIGTENGPMNSWAWLLELSCDESLAFLYRSLKEIDTLQEVLHETGDVPPQDPSALGGVRFFPDVGTAVFRSGWEDKDFIFVFRSGPFFNHQHMDQGSFYLADHGEIFLEERYDGEHHYYDDPVYRSHAIQAISHNTFLLNRNPQSQKVGDPKGFAAGMNDQARLLNWLETPGFAFAAGNLEKVYMDEVRRLRRNVLHIKPRAVLLVDEVVPAAADVEVNRLFHTKWKKDIAAGGDMSKISKGAAALYMYHLAPTEAVKEVLTEPHFLYQYSARPLVERGYLQVSKKTEGRRLVFADLLSATPDSAHPPFEISKGLEVVFIRSTAPAKKIAVALNLGSSVSLGEWSSDALILASSSAEEILLTGGTALWKDGEVVLRSEQPFFGWLRWEKDGLLLEANLEVPAAVTLRVESKPGRVVLNGRPTREFKYDLVHRVLRISLPPGPVEIKISRF
jgi:hypothetical protein